jgi:hypothetical protein
MAAPRNPVAPVRKKLTGHDCLSLSDIRTAVFPSMPSAESEQSETMVASVVAW